MAKTKLTVRTDVGTFTRTTARAYTHVVLTAGYSDLFRTEQVLGTRKMAAKNVAYVACLAAARGCDMTDEQVGQVERERAMTTEAGALAEVDRLYPADTAFGVYAWCGRQDLALRQADRCRWSRHVRVYTVDGVLVKVVR